MHICGKEDEKAPKRVKTREVYYSDLENIPVDVLELLMSMLDANERLNFRSISPILNQRFGYRWLHWIPVVMSMDDLKALSVNVRKHITILTLIGNDQVDDLKQLGLNRLTHLTFGFYFNQPVDSLPQSVTHLTFSYSFNQPVDSLPESVTHLAFGVSFSQPVNSLPKNVTHLTFGNRFNQPVNSLPESVTHLTFGYYFNQPVNRLPESLIQIHLYRKQLALFKENILEGIIIKLRRLL